MPIIKVSKINNTIITKHKMRERELPIQRLSDERKTSYQNIVFYKVILLGEMEKVRVYIYISRNQAKSEVPKSAMNAMNSWSAMNGGNRWKNKVK